VLERKAKANYEVAHNEAQKNGIVNEWTKRALEALALLDPKRYQVLKEPRVAVQIDSVSPAPIVRAPPGAAPGGEWKPGGK
jgi:hypothetical protein